MLTSRALGGQGTRRLRAIFDDLPHLRSFPGSGISSGGGVKMVRKPDLLSVSGNRGGRGADASE